MTTTVDALLRRADLALYDAKRSGRNRVRSYHDGLEAGSGQVGVQAA